MKVVLFSRYPATSGTPRGGVEAVTVVLARALARIDFLEVNLITLEKGLSREVEELDGKVRIHRLPAPGWPQIADIIAGPGRKKLLDKIGRIDPDVVHSHETYGLFMGRINYPHVFTVHGFDHANLIAESAHYKKLRSSMWRIVERVGLSRHDEIISISPYVRKMIEPMTTARIHDIDNPVDEAFFGITRREQVGRVLCVGWINSRKNTIGSIRAFAGALESGCAGKLAIAGDAKTKEYMDKVQSVIKELGMEANVEILGHIGRSRLMEELATASVMLLPSLQENAPMAISEAMAAGVPVIASNRCGMPYMVEEGGSGFLIDPVNTEQISDRIARLLRSESLRRSMGARGKEIAFGRFHPDVIARRTRDAYEMAVAGN